MSADPVDQPFQGREPPNVQNVALYPTAESTLATAAIPATPWRAGLQQEITHVKQQMSQTMDAQYQGKQNLVAQSQASVQASVQASMEAMFRQCLGGMQGPAARPPASAALGAPSPQPT